MATSFTWSTRREGNDGYVLEVCVDTQGELDYRKEYGPMPPHIVPAFVRGRREIVEICQANNGQFKSTPH